MTEATVSTMHRLTTGCDRPGARGRYSTSLWVCPECGQAWRTVRQQPPNIAPTVLSWWWVSYPQNVYARP